MTDVMTGRPAPPPEVRQAFTEVMVPPEYLAGQTGRDHLLRIKHVATIAKWLSAVVGIPINVLPDGDATTAGLVIFPQLSTIGDTADIDTILAVQAAVVPVFDHAPYISVRATQDHPLFRGRRVTTVSYVTA